jgi:hypothetical protein
MANKTETALAFVNGAASQASNRVPGNNLHAVLLGEGSVGDRLKAKDTLNQDPDMSLLAAEYAVVAAAVATHNAASVITIPSLAEVTAAIDAAPSANPPATP